MCGYCWNHNQAAPRKARGAHKGKAGSGGLVQCRKAVGGLEVLSLKVRPVRLCGGHRVLLLRLLHTG